jgi:hypothetical protein
MQPLSSLDSNLGTAILLVGGAGTGKTALSMRLFPKTYVLVSDLNFDSGRRYLEKLGQIDNVVGADILAVENGKPVPINQQYGRMLKLYSAAIADPSVDCIASDSMTFIEDVIKAKICNAPTADAIRLDGFKQWGDLKLCWKSLIMQLRTSGKKIVFTAHETKEQDESDKIYKYKIAIDGSTAALLPALFSDVWRCEIIETGAGVSAKHEWKVRALGNVRQEHLKNTYGFDVLQSHEDVIRKVRAEA